MKKLSLIAALFAAASVALTGCVVEVDDDWDDDDREHSQQFEREDDDDD